MPEPPPPPRAPSVIGDRALLPYEHPRWWSRQRVEEFTSARFRADAFGRLHGDIIPPRIDEDAPIPPGVAREHAWLPTGCYDRGAAAADADAAYLLPLGPFGTGNQLLALKEAMTLARATGRMLVLPPLFPHPDDHASRPRYAFAEALDTCLLGRAVRWIAFDDYCALHGSRVDATLVFGNRAPRLFRAAYPTFGTQHAPARAPGWPWRRQSWPATGSAFCGLANRRARP